MEHTIIFDDVLDEERVQGLIDRMSMYQFVNLYFSTEGGELYSTNVLIDYLNMRYRNNSIRIFIGPCLISAGTFLLTDYDGPIYLTKSFRFFMFHAPDFPKLNIRTNQIDSHLLEMLHEDNEDYYNKLLTIGITKKDIERIKKGEDIYYYRSNLDKLKINFFEHDYESQETVYKVYRKDQHLVV